MPCSQEGLRSRDEILGQAAADRGIPIIPLETNASVQIQRTNVPDRIYENQLRFALTGDARGKAVAKIVDALNIGDYTAIAAIFDGTFQHQSDAAIYHKFMVQERNQAWVPVLRPYLDAGHAVVLVGAAHLPGEDGLISLLVKAGYKVEPVILPTSKPLQR